MTKQTSERIIEFLLLLFAAVSILITVIIMVILIKESLPFFTHVSVIEFLTTTTWNPVQHEGQFGVIPLLVGTFMIVLIASVIALPIGLGSAVYMSEYANFQIKQWLKPILEILAGIPSVVYGFFALKFITPVIQALLPQTTIFNALGAGIAVGVMITPMVASLSEDAIKSVPQSIKEGAYALGMTKSEVVNTVILPAAISGVVAAFILAISRAIGETMIVAIAAGATPTLTFSPLQSIQTMTGYIVNKVQGEVVVGSIEYQTIYAVALLLFIITLIFNYIAKWVAKKYQNKYN